MRTIQMICVAMVLLLPQEAGAIGLAVKPRSLEVQQAIVGHGEAQLLVTNSTAEAAVYQVYPDAQQQNISITPTDFRLEAGESALVIIETHFALPARYQFDISIVARPLEVTSIRTASGVKVPLVVRI